ncbi:hypothetical protein ALQ35_05700 [Pseudomonas fluorescens]|nr:hypothetical protein ALQ35_05700 [Pseudomonas fluorescens]
MEGVCEYPVVQPAKNPHLAQCLQPLIAVAAVIDGKFEPFYPLHARLQPSVGMQSQPAVTRRLFADLEVFTARRELDAGGRRRQQAHAVALAVDFLVHMPPKHRLDLRKTVEYGKQSVGVAQADGLHPGTADGHRMMVKAHQVVPTRRLAQGLGQQLQLLVLQVAGHRTGNCRIQQGDAPVADVEHRLQQITVHGGVRHDLRLVVVAGNPARWRSNRPGQVTKLLIGLKRAVLGQIPGCQHQIDLRLLLAHQLDHPPQALAGVHAEQRALGLGKQVAVGQLHQQQRRIRVQGGYAWQGALPRQSQEMDIWRDYAGAGHKEESGVSRRSSHLPHDFELMAQGQAVTQPFTEEHIELCFLIGLVHEHIRVRIDAAKAPRMFGADHFGHARIVIHLDFQLRHRQPRQAVFLAHAQGGGVRAVDDDLKGQHAEHLVAMGHGNAPRFGRVAHVGKQAHQPRIVGLAGGLQPDQVDSITFPCLYCHNPLTSARLSASHCRAIMLAALEILPSRTACRASSNAQVVTRISSASSSSPWTPPAPALSQRPRYKWTNSVLPPGDGKYLVIGHSAENVSPASSSASRCATSSGSSSLSIRPATISTSHGLSVRPMAPTRNCSISTT